MKELPMAEKGSDNSRRIFPVRRRHFTIASYYEIENLARKVTVDEMAI
jgi:hypothetical protein